MTIKKNNPAVVPPTGGVIDNALVRFDGTTGRLIQNSLASLDDLGNLASTNINAILHNAQHIYVDNTLGNDVTGTGSIVKPLATIEAAVALCTNAALAYLIHASAGTHGSGETIVLPAVGNVSFRGVVGGVTQINKNFQLTAAAAGISFGVSDCLITAPFELDFSAATFFIVFFINGGYSITRTDTNAIGAVNVFNSSIELDLTGTCLVANSIFLSNATIRDGGVLSLVGSTMGINPSLEGTGAVIAQASIVTGTLTGTPVMGNTPQLIIDSSSYNIVPPTLVGVDLVLLDNSQYVSFTPAVPGQWSGVSTSKGGLDYLMANKIGKLDVDLAQVANVGGGESDLIVSAIAANTLNLNNSSLFLRAFGTTAANGNTKQIRAYLGATPIFDSGAVVLNDEDWTLEVEIFRTGVGTQKAVAKFFTSNNLIAPLVAYAALAEDETTALDLKCTGEAASNADIVQEGAKVSFTP